VQEALRKLREEYFTKWVDTDGLGLLGVDKPSNDNGLLFLVIFLILSFIFDETGEFFQADRKRFVEAVNSLRVYNADGSVRRGYFNRRPGDPTPEAHDNYVAIVVGAMVFQVPELIEEICAEIDFNGGSFANQAPGTFVARQLRQGSDIAFYQVLSFKARIPQPANMIWLVGGLVFNAFFGNPSSKNLGWLRVFAMSFKLTQFGSSLPNIYLRPLQLAISLWVGVIQLKGGPLASFKKYFSFDSPYFRIWGLR
jgi:hypothetical protein